FLGAYAGVKFAQPVASTEQKPVVNGDKQDVDNGIETPENMEKVIRAYHLIKDQYLEEVEGDLLLEGAIQGMLEVLDDPYSSYMDPEMNERFTEQLESSFEGIGAEVSRSEEHTSELQSRFDLVCRLLLEKKNNKTNKIKIV